MQKTKIEWTDYSWNPIKGLRSEKIFLDPKELKVFGGGFRRSDCGPRNSSKIFTCSKKEIFHPAIPRAWRDEIFDIIEKNFRHTFQILTKMPENIDRPMPDNVWLGVSVIKNDDWWRAEKLQEKSIKAKIKFLSLEPFLENLWNCSLFNLDWAIIGRLTGHGRKYDPEKEWIQAIVYEAKGTGIPVFMKDNLKEIWGEKLIQEFPEKEE